MLRFFNRIRRQLAKDNKFFQYSRYAFGEILLVVIGILIALQINNWNEERKDRQEEIYLLQSLQNEFQRNNIELAVIKQRYHETLDASLRTINGLRQNNSSSSYIELKEDIAKASFSLPVYYPIVNATNSIVSSGKLELIQSNELKNYLNQWEFYYRRYSKNVLLNPKSITEELLLHANRNMPIGRWLTPPSYVRTEDTLKPSIQGYGLDQIIEDPVLESLLETKRVAMISSLGNLIWVEKIQNDILSILAEELGKDNYEMEIGYAINDLRITGTAVDISGFNGFTDDVPLNLENPNTGIWKIELRLKPGGFVFKNRESWYNHWYVDGFPEGRLIHYQNPQDFDTGPWIEEPGLYRITVNALDLTYNCEKIDD